MLEKNVTQAELSKRTGITQSSLSDYIKGKYSPKQDKIDLIARALGVSPAYLMDWDDTEGLEEAKAKIEAVIEKTKKGVYLWHDVQEPTSNALSFRIFALNTD